MATVREIFAARFKKAREEVGISQKAVASELEVGRSVISDWEHAKTTPAMDRLGDISQVLKKPVSYFFTAAEDPKQFGIGNAELVEVAVEALARLCSLRRQCESMATALSHIGDVLHEFIRLDPRGTVPSFESHRETNQLISHHDPTYLEFLTQSGTPNFHLCESEEDYLKLHHQHSMKKIGAALKRFNRYVDGDLQQGGHTEGLVDIGLEESAKLKKLVVNEKWDAHPHRPVEKYVTNISCGEGGF